MHLAKLWLLIVTLVCAACAADEQKPPVSDDVDAGGLCTSCGGCAQTLPVSSALHVMGRVDYPDTPPASGQHNGRCWSDWGVLNTEVPPERWVHNLEHGGVVVLHHCEDGCAAELATLREFVSARRFTLLTSYAPLPTRFAVVSWGVRMLSDCLDVEAFGRFYDAHVDNAPESIDAPPAAICASVPDPLAL